MTQQQTDGSPSQPIFKTNSGITPEDVAAARAQIGVPLRLPAPFNSIVSRDAIRHFALGCGDDNPLWCDPAYGEAQGFGGVLAPPTFPYSVFPPGICVGFDGLQGFHGGSRWEFINPIREGDIITASATLTEVEEVVGRRSGPLIIEHGLAKYHNHNGQLVATNAPRLFRRPRAQFSSTIKREQPQPYLLSEAELLDLEEEVLAYKRRGEEPRYADETSVGEAMARRVKGPLVLNDIIAFSVGIGNVQSSELALKDRRRYTLNPDTAPTHRPLGWLLERVNPAAGHMDATVARAVGMPTVYDNGWLRVSWMAQYVTDWMGDAGTLRVLDVKIRLPNVLGDVLTLTGEVTGVRTNAEVPSSQLVELSIRAHRQDGEASCQGTATVELPVSGRNSTAE